MEDTTVKIIANHDGQIIISSRSGFSGAAPWMWYTFQVGSKAKADKTELRKIIYRIQQGELTPASHNGDYRNYLVDDMYISVTPPFRKSNSQKPDYIMLSETPEMYTKYVEPVVQCPDWITRIENGTAQGEVILSETDDYYLLPNFKWDRKIKNMYLLVIFKDSTLRSIRDLDARHLPLLERTRKQVMKYITDNYGIPASKMRSYFHYMPTAWRLHMHVEHISSLAALGSRTQCGRARTLGEVVNNIKLMPDYYQRSTMECVVNREVYNNLYIGGNNVRCGAGDGWRNALNGTRRRAIAR